MHLAKPRMGADGCGSPGPARLHLLGLQQDYDRGQPLPLQPCDRPVFLCKALREMALPTGGQPSA